jgi:hypothetical protein
MADGLEFISAGRIVLILPAGSVLVSRHRSPRFPRFSLVDDDDDPISFGTALSTVRNTHGRFFREQFKQLSACLPGESLHRILRLRHCTGPSSAPFKRETSKVSPGEAYHMRSKSGSIPACFPVTGDGDAVVVLVVRPWARVSRVILFPFLWMVGNARDPFRLSQNEMRMKRQEGDFGQLIGSCVETLKRVLRHLVCGD